MRNVKKETIYFKLDSDNKDCVANRIAADMRFAFTVEPDKNLPLLKAFTRLILASDNKRLTKYFNHYFKYFVDKFDIEKRYGAVQPDEQVLVDELADRIKRFTNPMLDYERKLGIPEDKTPSQVLEIDISKTPHYFYREQ